VIERASKLRRNLIELVGSDVEFAVGLLQTERGAARFRGRDEKGPPATLQAQSVRMNFSPGSLASELVCHLPSAALFDARPTIGFSTTASLKWSTTAATVDTPPSRFYKLLQGERHLRE
jgi:hypothetical protein